MTAKSFHVRAFISCLVAITAPCSNSEELGAQEVLQERNLYSTLSVATTSLIAFAYIAHDLSEQQVDDLALSTTCSSEIFDLSTSSSAESVLAAMLYVQLHVPELAMDVSLGSGTHLEELLSFLQLTNLSRSAHFLTTHLAAARRLRLIHLLLDEERPDTTLFLTTLLGHDT